MASIAVKSEPTFTLTLDQAELDLLARAVWNLDATEETTRLYGELDQFATDPF